LKDFRLHKLDITVDSDQNKIVLRLKSTAHSELGSYHGEYMITLYTTDDGKKVQRYEEFVDRELADKYVVPLSRLIARRAKQSRI
jgi:hypothetical protein